MTAPAARGPAKRIPTCKVENDGTLAISECSASLLTSHLKTSVFSDISTPGSSGPFNSAGGTAGTYTPTIPTTMDVYDVDSPPPIEVLDITGSLDAPSDDENLDDQLSEEENSSEWYSLPLHERWKNVVQRLIDEEVRWDDDEQPNQEWKPGVRVLDSRERESLADFNDRNTACPTVLHRLADNFKNDDFNKLPHMTQVKIVAYLLGEDRKARAQATVDSPDEPVLTRAFTNQNDEFIRFVIKHFYRDHLPDLVDDQDSSGSNCLHYVFKRHLPEAVDDFIRVKSGRKAPRTHRAITLDITKTLHYLDLLIRVAKPQCIVATDGDGNTPMHYAMAYRVCRMPTATYKKLALQLIEVGNKSKDRSRQFNNAQESPYLYFERTRQEFMTQSARLRSAQKPTQATAASSIAKRPGRGDISKPREHETGAAQLNVARVEKGSSMSHAVTKELMMKKPTGDSQESTKPSAAHRTLPAALQHTKESKRDMEALRSGANKFSMTSLARRETAGLIKNESEGVNLPRASSPALDPTPEPVRGQVEHRKEEVGEKNLEEPKADHDLCVQSAGNVRQQLKLHYIRNKSDLEAKELLYGRIASGTLYYTLPHTRICALHRSALGTGLLTGEMTACGVFSWRTCMDLIVYILKPRQESVLRCLKLEKKDVQGACRPRLDACKSWRLRRHSLIRQLASSG